MEQCKERRALHQQQQVDMDSTRTTIASLEEQLADQHHTLTQLEQAHDILTTQLSQDESRLATLDEMILSCQTLSVSEEQHMEALRHLLSKQPLRTLSAEETQLVWWRMDLSHLHSIAQRDDISGEFMVVFSTSDWVDMGFSMHEACQVQYMAGMMAQPGGLEALNNVEDEDCVVCTSCTVDSTINLLHERSINIPAEEIRKKEWITPYLIYAVITEEEFNIESIAERRTITMEVRKLRKAHEKHLNSLKEPSPSNE